MSAPRDDGGPAFPHTFVLANAAEPARGISVRDLMAVLFAAAKTIQNGWPDRDPEVLDREGYRRRARRAYVMADALLVARDEDSEGWRSDQ